MSVHDVKYFRRRGRAQNTPARELLPALQGPRQATGLERLEQLSWPRNLFEELASIAEPMAESADASEHADNVCPCGCCVEHKQNVSQMLQKPYGRRFDVINLRSEACKSRSNQERRRREGRSV
jgi:hypothetical protein